jgi:hypothetical protein
VNLIKLAERIAEDTVARMSVHEELDFAVTAQAEEDGPKLLIIVLMPGLKPDEQFALPIRFPTLNPAADVIDRALQESITGARAQRAKMILDAQQEDVEVEEAEDALP